MEELTTTGNTIVSVSPENIQLDRQVKKVLACKPILAIILKETVAECNEMSCEDIENCIEGDVLIEEVPLTPTEVITGNSQEDYLPGEGLIRYDIRTYLRLPGYDEPALSKILIDVEAQKEDTPGYSLAARGLFYCCRMISSQLDTEFTLKSTDQKKYDNIKKVYSIWICTDTSEKRQNSIEKYSMNKEMLFGQNDDDYRYDLLSAIIVNVGKFHDNEDTDSRMLNVLSILVDSNIDASKKIHMLKDKYDVPVTHEIEKEVTTMTSYTANIIAKGEAIGEARGKAIGEARGKAIGETIGEAKLGKLIALLAEANRNEDIIKASTDDKERQRLYKEFGITD